MTTKMTKMTQDQGHSVSETDLLVRHQNQDAYPTSNSMTPAILAADSQDGAAVMPLWSLADGRRRRR